MSNDATGTSSRGVRRFDMRSILADPTMRRLLVAKGVVATQAREGIALSLTTALAAYDSLEASGELERVRRDAKRWVPTSRHSA